MCVCVFFKVEGLCFKISNKNNKKSMYLSSTIFNGVKKIYKLTQPLQFFVYIPLNIFILFNTNRVVFTKIRHIGL